MNDLSEYKKYTLQARRGIKGEAFFESLISDYCIPHHITGPKDIGIDYICEWVYGDRPTGILFAAQVKTFSGDTTKPEFKRVETGLNNLHRYSIRNQHLKIDERTLLYWQGLGIPVNLFVVVQGTDMTMDCYYRRFTNDLTRDSIQANSIAFDELYYKVNDGNRFLAFANFDMRSGGFTRDLFIDYVRLSYHRGSIIHPEPAIFGLGQFEPGTLFQDLFDRYEKEIRSIYEITGRNLEALDRAKKHQ